MLNHMVSPTLLVVSVLYWSHYVLSCYELLDLPTLW
jgi:hypothetical protein